PLLLLLPRRRALLPRPAPPLGGLPASRVPAPARPRPLPPPLHVDEVRPRGLPAAVDPVPAIAVTDPVALNPHVAGAILHDHRSWGRRGDVRLGDDGAFPADQTAAQRPGGGHHRKTSDKCPLHGHVVPQLQTAGPFGGM